MKKLFTLLLTLALLVSITHTTHAATVSSMLGSSLSSSLNAQATLKTSADIKTFQLQNNLKADGILGPKTIQVLNQVSASQTAPSGSSATTIKTPVSTPTITVPVGTYTGPRPTSSAWTLACASGNPQIHVLSPNGGEVYQAGQQVTVKWESCNMPANAMVAFQLNYYPGTPSWGFSNGPWTTLNSAGSFSITLPNNQPVSGTPLSSGNYYKIAVFETGIPANPPMDDSDNLFTINGSTVISINCPAPIIAMNGAPTVVALPIPGSQTHQNGTFTIPFTVTAPVCSAYIPTLVSQLNNVSPRNKIQFTVNGSGGFISSGGSGGITSPVVVSGDSSGTYFIAPGSTRMFTATVGFMSTMSDVYRVSLYDIPWSIVNNPPQFTGNYTTGFASNLANNLVSPYLQLQ